MKKKIKYLLYIRCFIILYIFLKKYKKKNPIETTHFIR